MRHLFFFQGDMALNFPFFIKSKYFPTIVSLTLFYIQSWLVGSPTETFKNYKAYFVLGENLCISIKVLDQNPGKLKSGFQKQCCCKWLKKGNHNIKYYICRKILLLSVNHFWLYGVATSPLKCVVFYSIMYSCIVHEKPALEPTENALKEKSYSGM